MTISVTICISLNLFPHLYFAMFGQGELFTEVGTPTLRVVALALVFASAGTVWVNAVIGTGNSKITFLIEVISIIVYCAYVYVVLEVLKLSITVGWASELLYWSILFFLSYFYIRSGKWKSAII